MKIRRRKHQHKRSLKEILAGRPVKGDPPDSTNCIDCGAKLRTGQTHFCERCELKIEAEAGQDYLKSLELHDDFREHINECDTEFRQRYEEAEGDLENIKLKLEEFED